MKRSTLFTGITFLLATTCGVCVAIADRTDSIWHHDAYAVWMWTATALGCAGLVTSVFAIFFADNGL